jgi:hypothetical protein
MGGMIGEISFPVGNWIRDNNSNQCPAASKLENVTDELPVEGPLSHSASFGCSAVPVTCSLGREIFLLDPGKLSSKRHNCICWCSFPWLKIKFQLWRTSMGHSYFWHCFQDAKTFKRLSTIEKRRTFIRSLRCDSSGKRAVPIDASAVVWRGAVNEMSRCEERP